MVVNMENQRAKLDSLLWGLAVVLLVTGIGGQYYFASQSALVRVGGLLLAAVLAVGLITRTQFARNLWVSWQDALIELRKVVWPTKQETIQSTVAVLVVVFSMGIVLWVIDAGLVRIVAWIVRQGAV